MTNERKKDIREKIALGGLIVRAGLREADRAFLLGVLLQAAAVVTGSREHERLKSAGTLAFRDATANDGERRLSKTYLSRNGDEASSD